MNSDFRVAPDQAYWSCSPDGGPRIRILNVGTRYAEAVDDKTRQEQRQVPLNVLHASATTPEGVRRRSGYVLDDGVVDALPVVRHVQDLIAQRPHLPVAAIARRAAVAAATLQTLLRSDDGRRSRGVRADVAHRLLLLGITDLPDEERGYGGLTTDATAAMQHVSQILSDRPDLSVAVVARAAQMTMPTLAAALKDVQAGRPRTIKALAAQRLLALEANDLAPSRRKDSVDVAPVADHVRQLQEAYELASVAFIAKTAGVNYGTLKTALVDYNAGLRRGIHPEAAHQVLAVTHLPAPAFLRRPEVTDIGLTRRLRGLCALGWPLSATARAGSTTVKALTEFLRSGSATPFTRAAVLAAWAALSHHPGLSEIARQRAVARRWDPPLAWDEETIDVPDTRPCGTRVGGRSGEWTAELLRVEIDFLRGLGLNWTESLRRLGLGTQRAHELLNESGQPGPGCPDRPLPFAAPPGHALAA